MSTRKKFKDFYEDDDWSKKDSKRYDKKSKSIKEQRRKKDSLKKSYWLPEGKK